MNGIITIEIGYTLHHQFHLASVSYLLELNTYKENGQQKYHTVYEQIGLPFVEQWENQYRTVGLKSMEKELLHSLQTKELNLVQSIAKENNLVHRYSYDFDKHVFVIVEPLYRKPQMPSFGHFQFESMYSLTRPSLLKPCVAWHIQEELRHHHEIKLFLMDTDHDFMVQRTNYYVNQAMELVAYAMHNHNIFPLAKQAVQQALFFFPQEHHEVIRSFLPFHPMSTTATNQLLQVMEECGFEEQESNHTIALDILTLDEWHSRLEFHTYTIRTILDIAKHQTFYEPVIQDIVSFFHRAEVERSLMEWDAHCVCMSVFENNL